MITKQELQHEADSQTAHRFPQTKSRYQAIQPTALFVTSVQLSVSGNDFTIHESNGDLFMRTEGKAFDLKSRIDFFDSDGETVLRLRKEMLGPKARWIGENPSGGILFKIERQLSWPRTSHICTIDSAGLTRTVWKMKGDWSGNSAKIEDASSSNPAISITRSAFPAPQTYGVNKYAVQISPDVDALVAVAMCICYDECKRGGRSPQSIMAMNEAAKRQNPRPGDR